MNILYSKEERPRAGVVVHDCILALGRLAKQEKTNKQTRNSRLSLAAQQVQRQVQRQRGLHETLSQKSCLCSGPGPTAQRVCPSVLGSS